MYYIFLTPSKVSIGDESYLALPKGGLVPKHSLIVPIAHTPSCAEASPKAMEEIESFKTSLRRMYRANGMEMMCFERCVKTRGANHTHIQVCMFYLLSIQHVLLFCFFQFYYIHGTRRVLFSIV